MADGTDELAELEAELDADSEFQDEEASAAMSEAQSVIDDAKAAGGGVDLDDAGDTGDRAATGTASDSSADSGSRLPSLSLPSFSLPSPSLPSLDELWSTRFFIVAVVAAVGGAVAGGLVPIVDDIVGGAVAFFGASFLLGLASSRRHYVETSLAGAAVFGAFILLGEFSSIIREGGQAGLRMLSIGIGGIVLAALVGTLLGRIVRGKILDALPSAGDGGPDDDVPEL